MKLSVLAQETLTNMRNCANVQTPEQLVEQSKLTRYTSRISQVLLHLTDLGAIYYVDNEDDSASYTCEYGIKGIHDEMPQAYEDIHKVMENQTTC